ncbi:MAG TPA: STAS domain-containing protein [Actinomycetota bacterium]|nr:STAS domain-containing protein [Actinomycetota bacterium]
MTTAAKVEATPNGYRITGSIDIYNATEVAEQLGTAPKASPVMDLTGLDFLDSSGLAVIVNFAERVDNDITLVVQPGGAVHRLVNLVALPYRLELRSGS